MQNAGKINGTNFVKIVYDKKNDEIHFINNENYQFHTDYISSLLSTPSSVTRSNIDKFNIANYKSLDRRFFIGIVSFISEEKSPFFSLRDCQIDTMNIE